MKFLLCIEQLSIIFNFQFLFCFFFLTQRELDAEAAGMGRRQDESEAARKQLIELSREFKKTVTEVNKTKSRSTSFFFFLGGWGERRRGGWFLAGFLNELSRHRKLGHQYLRTAHTHISAGFDCSSSIHVSSFCSVCVWENFVDYQWNESSGQTTFSRPVL